MATMAHMFCFYDIKIGWNFRNRRSQTIFSTASENAIPVVLSSSSPSYIVQELKEMVDEFEYLIN